MLERLFGKKEEPKKEMIGTGRYKWFFVFELHGKNGSDYVSYDNEAEGEANSYEEAQRGIEKKKENLTKLHSHHVIAFYQPAVVNEIMIEKED